MPDMAQLPGMDAGVVVDGMLAEQLIFGMLAAPECTAADGRPCCGACGARDGLVLRRLPDTSRWPSPEMRPAGTPGTCGICGRCSSGLLCSSPAAWFMCRSCLLQKGQP